MSLKTQLERKDEKEMRNQTNSARFPLCYRQNFNERTENVGHQLWCPTATKKSSSEIRKANNDFLNEAFKPVDSARFDSCFPGLKNRMAHSEFLFKSVSKYFELVNEPFTLLPSGNLSLDCLNLYNALRSILPEEIGINFDCRNRDIEIVLFKVWNTFPSGQLFYIPVCPIMRMSPALRDCLIAFFGFMHRYQHISMPWENQDVCYFISDEYGFEWDEEEVDSDFKEIRESYNSGEARMYMDMINNSVLFPVEISDIIKKLYLLDFTYADIKLIDLLKEGLSIITEDRFFEYDYYPGNCIGYTKYHNDSIDTFGLERLFSFVWAWENDDMVTNFALEAVNNDCQELTEYSPADFMYLTLDMQHPFVPNDFPIRYAKWFNRFVCELEKYM